MLLPAVVDDTIEAVLEELSLKTVTPKAEPRIPLQNAIPEVRPDLSVVVCASECTTELLHVLERLNRAGELLHRRFGRKAELIVAAYQSGANEYSQPIETSPPGSAVGAAVSSEEENGPRYLTSSRFASAREFDARVVERNFPARSAAMNAAAAAARGNIFVFLEPGLMPEEESLCHILNATSRVASLGGGTNVSSEEKGLRYRLFSAILSIPLRIHGVSLGLLFIKEGFFSELQGFKESMLSGEMFEFALRLKKHAAENGKEFSNIKAVCATRNRNARSRLGPREWLTFLLLPLLWRIL